MSETRFHESHDESGTNLLFLIKHEGCGLSLQFTLGPQGQDRRLGDLTWHRACPPNGVDWSKDNGYPFYRHDCEFLNGPCWSDTGTAGPTFHEAWKRGGKECVFQALADEFRLHFGFSAEHPKPNVVTMPNSLWSLELRLGTLTSSIEADNHDDTMRYARLILDQLDEHKLPSLGAKDDAFPVSYKNLRTLIAAVVWPIES
jgi:hypothetical protein